MSLSSGNTASKSNKTLLEDYAKKYYEKIKTSD